MSTNTDIIKDDDIKQILTNETNETNEKQTSKIDDLPKELDRATLSQRFYADLIKDMSVPYDDSTKLTDEQIKKILSSSFNYNIPNYINVFSWTKEILKTRFNAVDVGVNRVNITKYKNILKTSTIAVGGFSSAPFQLYESGFGIDFICAISECFTVDTAAAHLDTAGKPKGKDIITSKIDIDITQKFFKELGFPGTLSVTTKWNGDKCNLTIDYKSTKIEGEIEGEIEGKIEGEIYPNRADAFKNYTLGNKEKNGVLKQHITDENPTKGVENAKILLVKELGDVLQVLEYYAIINYLEKKKNYKAEDIRKKFNIQTTDSVVFDLCVNMGLPVTYTGSREGVTSGGVSIYMYEYGKLDMAEVYKNRFGKIYDGLIAQLNSVQFGITTGIAMLKQISYKVPKGWTKPTRTRKTIEIDTADIFYENTQTPGDQFKELSEESTKNKIGLLQSILDKITKTKDTVTTVKKRLTDSITSKGDEFDILVNELTKASSFKVEHEDKQITSTKDLPLLTKVKGVGYVIQNDKLAMLFAEYSGYVNGSNMGGGSSSSSSSSKMDENDPNFGVALSIEYANVVKDAQNNDITYPKLLEEYGGYKMDDKDTKVFMDERTANEIVNKMNVTASKYLHIANDNHKEEIIILLDEYLARLVSLSNYYNWKHPSEGTRSNKRTWSSFLSNTYTSTQSNSTEADDGKMDVEKKNEITIERQELGLEECIYLKKAYNNLTKPNEDDSELNEVDSEPNEVDSKPNEVDTRLCIPDYGCNPSYIKIDGNCISINDIMNTTLEELRNKRDELDKKFNSIDFNLDDCLNKFKYLYYTKGKETKAIEDAATITKINNCFMSFTDDWKDYSSITTNNNWSMSFKGLFKNKRRKTTNSSSQGGKARKLTKKKQKKNQKQRTRRKRKTRRKNMRKTIKKKRINKKRKTIKKRNGKNNK